MEILNNKKLPISAFVVSYNEAITLGNCLSSLSFCDEIHVVDIGSLDNSLDIAKEFTTNIHTHDKVDMVEQLFQKFIPLLKHEWVLLIDPDERLDPKLVEDIVDFFQDIPEDCGRINVPILYYYKKRALKGTVWGNNKVGRLLVRKTGCHIGDSVHTAITLREGFKTYKIKKNGMNVDHHYWVNSFSQMLEKHRRYTAKEGKARYLKGDR